MGNLLRLLSRDDGCCSHNKLDLFLDFENAQPSPSEEHLFEDVAQALATSREVTAQLQLYRGAAKEIRQAITDADPASQRVAWEAVSPLVAKLHRFWAFSSELADILVRILEALCSPSAPPCTHLEAQQALVKQLAEILEFTLKFDELKMTTPAIQNDFSYYRRSMMRSRMDPSYIQPGDTQDADSEETQLLDHQTANKMSLFYAYPTPMLRVVSDATSRFVQEHKEIPLQQTTETLGTMAKVCQRMLDSPDLVARFRREETHLFILRVMVALVILYDHVHPCGAFAKASAVDVKGCVRLLLGQPATASEGLLNALRYSTKHLNDDSTPKHIRTLLAV